MSEAEEYAQRAIERVGDCLDNYRSGVLDDGENDLTTLGLEFVETPGTEDAPYHVRWLITCGGPRFEFRFYINGDKTCYKVGWCYYACGKIERGVIDDNVDLIDAYKILWGNVYG